MFNHDFLELHHYDIYRMVSLIKIDSHLSQNWKQDSWKLSEWGPKLFDFFQPLCNIIIYKVENRCRLAVAVSFINFNTFFLICFTVWRDMSILDIALYVFLVIIGSLKLLIRFIKSLNIWLLRLLCRIIIWLLHFLVQLSLFSYNQPIYFRI